MLAGVAADDPGKVRTLLDQRTRQMAIQCGEPGPFAQITGAVDQALWDMAARRAKLPLWQLLGGSSARVRVYASGIGPDKVVAVALAKQARGIAYCPHWLAGGIGLAASLHALAGSGTTGGWAEVDANPNPLREQVLPLKVVDGWATLPDAPGLGLEPDLQALASYLVVV